MLVPSLRLIELVHLLGDTYDVGVWDGSRADIYTHGKLQWLLYRSIRRSHETEGLMPFEFLQKLHKLWLLGRDWCSWPLKAWTWMHPQTKFFFLPKTTSSHKEETTLKFIVEAKFAECHLHKLGGLRHGCKPKHPLDDWIWWVWFVNVCQWHVWLWTSRTTNYADGCSPRFGAAGSRSFWTKWVTRWSSKGKGCGLVVIESKWCPNCVTMLHYVHKNIKIMKMHHDTAWYVMVQYVIEIIVIHWLMMMMMAMMMDLMTDLMHNMEKKKRWLSIKGNQS